MTAMRPETPESVGLILCTYGRLDYLRRLCQQLSQLETLPTEIVVVAQEITPEDARELVSSFGPQFQDREVDYRVYVSAEPNLPLARNLGALQCTSSLLLYLDDDVVLTSEIVAQHRLAHTNSEDVVAVGGKILGAHPWPVPALPNSAAVPRIIGCNMSFRRSALENIGGFDPAFAPASTGEETDVCDRLVRAGGRLIYAEAAELEHLKAPTGGERGRVRDDAYVESYVRNAAVLWFRAHGRLGLVGLLKHPRWLVGFGSGPSFSGLLRAWGDRRTQDYLNHAAVYAETNCVLVEAL